MKRLIIVCVLALLTVLGVGALHSDALVVTRAMLASTISEIFIEEDSVVVEFEIGGQDMEAFRNLVPDEIYDRIESTPRPWAERLAEFTRDDFVLHDGAGRVLPGRLVSLEARTRVPRDEVTGEPLPVPPGEGEPVLFARLRYDLENRPDRLTLTPPRSPSGSPANIGFVAYHDGLHVNDFRYLGTSETIKLDWSDPWYSEFENRNMRRQFYSPISAFLYIEPYEVRKEIVLRPRDLSAWIDLELDDSGVITVAQQETIKEKVVAFLADRNPVTIDGQLAHGALDRVHFIFRNLRTSGVIEPARDLDAVSATMGVIFYYPVDGLPEEVTLEWELFADRVQSVPTSASDEAGALPYIVTPDDNVLRWKNFLTNPTIPQIVEVAAPSRYRMVFALLALVCVAGLVWLFREYSATIRSRQSPPRRAVAGAVGLMVLLVLVTPRALGVGISDAEADTVVVALLKNVYRAFDYRDEERIYDTLERSASGDLLTDIYLETRRSLELENQGGARAKVKEVELVEGEYSPIDGGSGFESHVTWNVMGSIGHWGHIHQRINRYEARFVVRAVDGVWKITQLDLIDEQRL